MPGFKVTGNPTYTYIAGTNPDMRTTYDANMPFTKQNVDFRTACAPIFKNNPLKSASIAADIETEDLEPTNVSIFPNPANGLLTVSSNKLIQSITVVNAAGKVWFDFADINMETFTFDISGLSQGVYFVKIIMQNGYENVEKVLKKE